MRNRFSSMIPAFCLAAMSCVTQAQPPAAAPQPAFEAASIRRSHFTPGCFSMLPPGGAHYAVTCVTLRNLIALAWKVNPDNNQGGDSRALDTYYDIAATTPDGKSWSYDLIPPMMRKLLIERFHVAVHTGTKEASGFGLIVAKGGPRLKTSDSDSMQAGQKAGVSSPNIVVPGYIRGRGASLSLIASLLSGPAHATVVDQTGIVGVFNIDLHFAVENVTDPNLPDLFTAVEEQLGLRLKPEKITVDTLVIDRTDSGPTAN